MVCERSTNEAHDFDQEREITNCFRTLVLTSSMSEMSILRQQPQSFRFADNSSSERLLPVILWRDTTSIPSRANCSQAVPPVYASFPPSPQESDEAEQRAAAVPIADSVNLSHLAEKHGKLGDTLFMRGCSTKYVGAAQEVPFQSLGERRFFLVYRDDPERPVVLMPQKS